MKRIICLAICLFVPLLIHAQKKQGEAASIKNVEIKGEVKPGAEVTAVIDVAVEKDYHTHSNKPSDPQFIPTVLTLSPLAGVKAGSIKYPAGKSETVKGLDKPLSVYEREFQISVPLKLGKEVVLPLTVPATLSYQACQGAVCYPPKKLKFEISLKPAGPKK